ncbi:MAG TPA: hypothetical protein VHG09_12075 [Longimicrobiales bacterium]|nr:hypothetical protein [Longimicrobiales bacterium]
MNERTFRPANISAAAVAIGGVLIAVLPQHAMSITVLVIAAIAAAAGLYALAVNAPPAWWRSPFDAARAGGRRTEPDDIDRIRSRLSGRRQRIARDTALPPGTLRMLQPLIHVALEREGIETDDEAAIASARTLVSPLTWAVLTTEPMERPGWIRTMRPATRHTADVVHRVLNDLGRLADGRRTPQQHDPRDLRAT